MRVPHVSQLSWLNVDITCKVGKGQVSQVAYCFNKNFIDYKITGLKIEFDMCKKEAC